MARIPLVDPGDADLDPETRQILVALSASDLGLPNVLRAMANHPAAMQGMGGVVYGPHSVISPAHRELAYLTASVANSCHY